SYSTSVEIILEPNLLKIFLRFILLHRQENVHILDTLTSRINTPFRLCVVSLAFFRALIVLHCEDVMLQLILSGPVVKERDCYSAAKLLVPSPLCCSTGITLTLESQGKDYILWTKPAQTKGAQGKTKSLTEFDLVAPYGRNWKRIEGEGNVIVVGTLLNLLALWNMEGLWKSATYSTWGKLKKTSCSANCRVWSALYDGINPDPDTFIQTLAEENSTDVEHPMFRLQQRTPSTCNSVQAALFSEKMQLEHDSYGTGISPSSNDTQDDDSSKEKSLNVAREHKVQSQTIVNGSLAKTQLEMDLDEHSKRNSSSTKGVIREQINQKMTEIDPQPDLKISSQEVDCDLSVKLLSTDGEDFIAQYDRIIKELDPNRASLEEQKLDAPDPVSPAEEDFENFSADTPSAESTSSPFGPKEDVSSKHSPRSQSALFTVLLQSEWPLAKKWEDLWTIVWCCGRQGALWRELGEHAVMAAVSETGRDGKERLCFMNPGAVSVLVHQKDTQKQQAELAGHPDRAGVWGPAAEEGSYRLGSGSGPFISIVLSKLENMLENSLHVLAPVKNMIERLLPLEKTSQVFPWRPNSTCIFVWTCLMLHKNCSPKINDNYAQRRAGSEHSQPPTEFTYENLKPELVGKTNSDFPTEQKLLYSVSSNVQHNSNTGKGKNLPEAHPAVLQPFLGQKGKKGLTHPSLPVHVRNTVLAAALFPEFLKELAALAQEHSILSSDTGYFSYMVSHDLVRLSHTGCCVSFQGDGEEPINPYGGAFVLLPQPSRTAEWAAALEPLLLPQGSGSSPPLSGRRASKASLFGPWVPSRSVEVIPMQVTYATAEASKTQGDRTENWHTCDAATQARSEGPSLSLNGTPVPTGEAHGRDTQEGRGVANLI
ncbi:hypothetical protein IHE44_0013163, partial [Lamprotornis superbus]